MRAKGSGLAGPVDKALAARLRETDKRAAERIDRFLSGRR